MHDIWIVRFSQIGSAAGPVVRCTLRGYCRVDSLLQLFYSAIHSISRGSKRGESGFVRRQDRFAGLRIGRHEHHELVDGEIVGCASTPVELARQPGQ